MAAARRKRPTASPKSTARPPPRLRPPRRIEPDRPPAVVRVKGAWMTHKALAGAALAVMTLLAACVPRPAPTPAPVIAPPPPAPPPPPTPPPPLPPALDWRDAPLAPGDWR